MRAAARRGIPPALAAVLAGGVLLFVGGALLFTGGVLLLPGTARAGEAPPIVIVVSWDGVRHDYPDWCELPALARVARDGVRAAALVPPFPSNTFPSHVSMATGTHPDRHGIVGNEFWDGDRHFDYSADASWLEAEPLWITAERQGVTSAVFFWVGSETAWRGRAATYRRTPFDRTVSEAEKVEQILGWLDLPETRRPRLVMSWWHGADRVAHRRGPERGAVCEALEEQDAQLARLLAGLDERKLWPRTTLLVVSDHGMVRGARTLDPEGALRKAGVAATVVRAGGAALVYLEDPGQQRREAGRVLAELAGVTAYARDAIPDALRVRHGRRTGDFLLVAEPPGMFARGGAESVWLVWLARLLGRGPGMHGYRPEHPDMAGIFFALGRGAVPGARLDAVHAVDLAPTAAALLGIDPPRHSEGQTRLGGPAR
ncbi:MAG: ectonucleotide pyrophosphatase/phosphodiesterase [Myxococcota bacterium]|nr:ectonucleotide pyrophosphatase/phosphodiesterase [Myxococcota bacterium]